ncbi:MAG: helix-turn-helix transcriptional regulator [Pseudonocardiaceae bacterium]
MSSPESAGSRETTGGKERMADLMTTAEVAARLRRPAETLRYWRWRGEGPPSFKIGRSVVYDSDALEAWIEARRRQSGTGAADR